MSISDLYRVDFGAKSKALRSEIAQRSRYHCNRHVLKHGYRYLFDQNRTIQTWDMAITGRKKWVKCDRYGRGADLCVTNTTTLVAKRYAYNYSHWQKKGTTVDDTTCGKPLYVTWHQILCPDASTPIPCKRIHDRVSLGSRNVYFRVLDQC